MSNNIMTGILCVFMCTSLCVLCYWPFCGTTVHKADTNLTTRTGKVYCTLWNYCGVALHLVLYWWLCLYVNILDQIKSIYCSLPVSYHSDVSNRNNVLCYIVQCVPSYQYSVSHHTDILHRIMMGLYYFVLYRNNIVSVFYGSDVLLHLLVTY